MKTLVKMLAGIVVCSVAALTAGLVLFVTYVFRPDAIAARPIVQTSDGIVILTGGDERLREGLKLFEQNHGRRVLISGVGPATSRADLRRMFAMPAVLADCCLDLGYAAQNTIGNALETRTWAEAWGFQRLILVTSDFHIPRSLLEIKRVLPDVDVVTYPVPSRPPNAEAWWRHTQTRNAVAKEYAKFLTTFVRFAATRLVGLSPADALPAGWQTVAPKGRGVGG